MCEREGADKQSAQPHINALRVTRSTLNPSTQRSTGTSTNTCRYPIRDSRIAACTNKLVIVRWKLGPILNV